MLDEKFAEEQWLKHAYDGFPREVSTQFSRRVRVLNEHNYKYLIWKTFGFSDCFTSIYPTSFVNADGVITLNKIFFDIDDEEHPEVAYDSMRRIVQYFIDEYGYCPRVNFSGKKGYHLYIDFEPVDFKVEYFKPVVRAFIAEVMSRSGAKIVDNSAIADAAGVTRVSRIPYTLHPKTGALCIPILPDWSIDEIKARSKELNGIRVPVIIRRCKRIGDELLEKALHVSEDFLANIGSNVPTSVDETILSLLGNEILYLLQEIAPGYYDGRHRMIWALLLPRLAIIKGGGKYQDLRGEQLQQVNTEIKSVVRDFIDATPWQNPDGTPREQMQVYMDYCDLSLDRLNKQYWSPWKFETFWLEYPDLAKFFMRKQQNPGEV